MLKARVIKSSKREFICKTDVGEITATALGNLLKGDENSIVVGDYVMIDQGVIVEVLPRTSEIFRLIVREQKKKVTASNCDVMVILTSVSRPEYKRGLIDRFLVRAFQWGIHPLVVFNKMDQYDEGQFDIKFEVDRLKSMSIESFEISAINENYQPRFLTLSLVDLKKRLENKTSIFLGQSGVGKSKTIGQVSEGQISLLSRDVGKKGKGTHTTTWSEIVYAKNMAMIDSPGIRSFGVEDLYSEDVMSYFPDLAEFAVKCKFRNCSHEAGTKGCFFHDELNPNEREDQLILSRLDSFLRLYEEIANIPTYLKK